MYMKKHPCEKKYRVPRQKLSGLLVVLGFDVAVSTPAPIHVIVFDDPHKRNLILWKASRLDAFSAYPYPTRIPGGAPGGTTGKTGGRSNTVLSY